MILTAISIMVACLLLQAFFAGSEMAVISSNRLKIRHRAEKGERNARIIQGFLDEPRDLLATTLVGYNLMVVIGSCILNSLLAAHAPRNTENIFSVLIYLPFVLVVGQIVPMSIGRQYANTISLLCAWPLTIAFYILYPLVFVASLLGRGITRIFTRGRSKKNPFVTKEEIESLLKESHEAGMLRREEKDMIAEIFHFGETSVREAMVPLIDVTAAPETATVGELLRLFAETGHSRIPIFRERIDRIVGTVTATDLSGVDRERTAAELMSPPRIVPESASLERALADLRNAGRHMAIAVDEYGGVAGILTIEDIAEEIVGEIDDEYDTDASAEWRGGADSIVVDGRMRVERFNALFEQRLPLGVAETIAGFVLDAMDGIPAPSDEVSYEHLTFRIIEADDRRVQSIEVRGIREPA